MKRNIIVYALISLFIIIVFLMPRRDKVRDTLMPEESNFSNSSGIISRGDKEVRPPQVAGQFYPALPNKLKSAIKQILDTNLEVETIDGSDIIGLLVPHAAYQFSGNVAGSAYRLLEGKVFDTVIIIGNSHYQFFPGVSVFPKGFYQTPIGTVEVDKEFAKDLINFDSRITYYKKAHLREHSIEVQIPFLQTVLRPGFKIVPILFGNEKGDDSFILARAIINVSQRSKKKILVIASSDLSHYPSSKDARSADLKTLEAIEGGNVEEFAKVIKKLETEHIPGSVTFACGQDAIKTLLQISLYYGASGKLIKYLNSGEVDVQSKERSVGYGAVAFVKQKKFAFPKFSKEDREKMLMIAKQSVEGVVNNNNIPKFTEQSSLLNLPFGAFVTIKKQGNLRGCIGTYSPSPEPLYITIQKMAVSAAMDDNRFEPVKKEELPFLSYEISILSPLERIDDWKKINLGEDGVSINLGSQSGVFLPQVYTETGWNLEKFLSELCRQKLGLNKDCYKEKSAEIYIFKADVFK